MALRIGAECEVACIHVSCLIIVHVINVINVITNLVSLPLQFKTYRVGIFIIADCHIIFRPKACATNSKPGQQSDRSAGVFTALRYVSAL
jgi:hypothetical protein